MTAFDVVEILCEFSKAIRLSLIAFESLHDLDGVVPVKYIEHCVPWHYLSA